MKNKIKMLALSLVTTVLCLAPIAASAQAYQDAMLNEAIKLRSAGRFAADTAQCLNLTYVGSSSEAVVTIGIGAITAYAPAGVADSSNFGISASSYAFSVATADTMGELCDSIDALADYKCTLLGCDRAQLPKFLKDQTAASGTNDLKANGGFNVLLATGAVGEIGPGYDVRLGINPRTDHRVILKTCTGNGNVIGTFVVKGKLAKYEGVNDGVTRDDTTVVWSAVTADDTDLQIPVDLTDNGWLEFAKNAHVVVSIGNGTSLQAAANTVECQWDEKR